MSEGKPSNAQEEIQVTFEKIKAEIPTVYVNNAEFSTTQWDMRIDLSELYSLNVEKKTMSIVPRARLIMDFRFAQRFVQAMQQNLQRVQEALREEMQDEQAKLAKPQEEK